MVVVVPVAATPVPAPVKAPPPAPPPPRAGISPVWLYAGIGATAVLTGLTVWSGVDTQRAYSDYRRDRPGLTQDEAEARVDDGHARERRTNFLLAGSLLGAAGSTVLGVWLVDFSPAPRTKLSVTAGRVALTGSF